MIAEQELVESEREALDAYSTIVTTVANDSISKNNSAYNTTNASDGAMPASASTRKRAGSAPVRAGVSEARSESGKAHFQGIPFECAEDAVVKYGRKNQ